MHEARAPRGLLRLSLRCSMVTPAPTPPVVTESGSWVFSGVVDRVIDGDSAMVVYWIDTGHGERTLRTREVRVAGIDAPDLISKGKREATAHATELFAGKAVRVEVLKREKYGRDLAHVELVEHPVAVDWAAAMLEAGHAVPYDGGPRS